MELRVLIKLGDRYNKTRYHDYSNVDGFFTDEHNNLTIYREKVVSDKITKRQYCGIYKEWSKAFEITKRKEKQ